MLEVRLLPFPRAEIESKVPHKTCWMTLYYKEGDAGFLGMAKKALAAEGWVDDPSFCEIPALEGVAEANFYSLGTGLFNMWTPIEQKAKMASLRRALKVVGIPAYRRKLTLADML